MYVLDQNVYFETIFFYYFKVISTPNMGVGLTTPL